jgi:hypothetical protein
MCSIQCHLIGLFARCQLMYAWDFLEGLTDPRCCLGDFLSTKHPGAHTVRRAATNDECERSGEWRRSLSTSLGARSLYPAKRPPPQTHEVGETANKMISVPN